MEAFHACIAYANMCCKYVHGMMELERRIAYWHDIMNTNQEKKREEPCHLNGAEDVLTAPQIAFSYNHLERLSIHPETCHA